MGFFSKLLGIRFGLDGRWAETVSEFSRLHDIGKVAIPDGILLKPSRLTLQERAVMCTHTTHGLTIVEGLVESSGMIRTSDAAILKAIVELHHESPDGSGYPHGLRDTAIPIEARIVKVADIFDALTTPRPYKSPWPVDQALDWLRGSSGVTVDAIAVDIVLGLKPELEAIQARWRDQDAATDTRAGIAARIG